MPVVWDWRPPVYYPGASSSGSLPLCQAYVQYPLGALVQEAHSRKHGNAVFRFRDLRVRPGRNWPMHFFFIISDPARPPVLGSSPSPWPASDWPQGSSLPCCLPVAARPLTGGGPHPCLWPPASFWAALRGHLHGGAFTEGGTGGSTCHSGQVVGLPHQGPSL